MYIHSLMLLLFPSPFRGFKGTNVSLNRRATVLLFTAEWAELPHRTCPSVDDCDP